MGNGRENVNRGAPTRVRSRDGIQGTAHARASASGSRRQARTTATPAAPAASAAAALAASIPPSATTRPGHCPASTENAGRPIPGCPGLEGVGCSGASVTHCAPAARAAATPGPSWHDRAKATCGPGSCCAARSGTWSQTGKVGGLPMLATAEAPSVGALMPTRSPNSARYPRFCKWSDHQAAVLSWARSRR